jgi:hypothetical protein
VYIGTYFSETWHKVFLKTMRKRKLWVNFGNFGSNSGTLGQFLELWVNFGNFGSISGTLGQFRELWLNFGNVGSISFCCFEGGDVKETYFDTEKNCFTIFYILTRTPTHAKSPKRFYKGYFPKTDDERRHLRPIFLG